MSLLYDVLFATRCSSNHHRLALDALQRFNGRHAARWRSLFLHHHEAYLEGAKAPDTQFKDFKNHVLHVGEGEWGGALQAAGEWQRRMVRSLSAKEWKQGVYCAGVLSHYVVDPFQPFHTGQTEAEGVIHAAVERSFSKAFGEMQTFLLRDLGGYPDVTLSDGADWLAQAIRAGAHAAHPSYDLIIDHYDFTRGAKDPKAGLDQEIKDAVAKLIGLASVTLSRVLERSFDEAAVTPPKIDETLDAVFASLKGPVSWITGKIEDAETAALVKAQYAEFQARGKVIATLSEDDAMVRRLHCEEVRGILESSLDAEWPREVGSQHGTGAPPRSLKAKRPAAAAAPPKSAAAPPPPQAAAPAPKPKAEPKPQPEPPAPPPPQPAAAAEPEPLVLTQTAPETPATEDEADPILQQAACMPNALRGQDPVVDAPSIGPKTAARLREVGVRTVSELLRLSPEAVAAALNTRHITAPLVRDWQDQALLACHAPGLNSRDAQTLVACEVRDVEALAQADAATLLAAATAFAASKDGERLWPKGPPTQEIILRWIAAGRVGAAMGERAA
jgi:predicted flap endonuclease-1-like 5' DNA nuclease